MVARAPEASSTPLHDAASDPAILTSVIGPDEVRLSRSEEQHGNWLECIRTRHPPVAPAEIAHILDVSERTIYKDWHFAKMWLSKELAEEDLS